MPTIQPRKKAKSSQARKALHRQLPTPKSSEEVAVKASESKSFNCQLITQASKGLDQAIPTIHFIHPNRPFQKEASKAPRSRTRLSLPKAAFAEPANLPQTSKMSSLLHLAKRAFRQLKTLTWIQNRTNKRPTQLSVGSKRTLQLAKARSRALVTTIWTPRLWELKCSRLKNRVN